MTALTGEVLEQRDGEWRTVRLGNFGVNDRRRVSDPLMHRWLYTTVATQPNTAFLRNLSTV